jgi:hypothetical protein
LKLAVIVAAVVAGILLLTKGFDESGPAPRTVVTETPTTTPTTTTAAPPDEEPAACVRQGVIVYVYNGTQENGLAALAADELQAEGYVVPAVGNAPSPFQVTTLYFKGAQNRVEAECLEDSLGVDAEIQRLAADLDVPKDAQVAIYLGNDYAALNRT